jgi:hypothetical protein
MANNGLIRFKARLTPATDVLGRKIDNISAEATNWLDFWPTIAETLAEGVKRIITSKGQDLSATVTYGHPWRRPKPEYTRRKARGGHGAIDLVFTGEVIRRVTSADAGTVEIAPRFMIFGVRNNRYVQYLNFVKRPFLGMSRWMEQEVRQDMQDYLDFVVRKAFQGVAK